MLTQTSQTAINVMILMARRTETEPVAAHRLGEFVGGSPTYVAKTVRDLVRAGLLESRRGALGGVSLARSPESITLLQIVEAVHGVTGSNHCESDTPLDAVCAYHRAMWELREAHLAVLSRWTLADLREPYPPNPACKMRGLLGTAPPAS